MKPRQDIEEVGLFIFDRRFGDFLITYPSGKGVRADRDTRKPDGDRILAGLEKLAQRVRMGEKWKAREGSLDRVVLGAWWRERLEWKPWLDSMYRTKKDHGERPE